MRQTKLQFETMQTGKTRPLGQTSNLIRIKQTDRTCWSMYIQSAELSRVKRRTHHELTSLSLARLRDRRLTWA